MSSLKKLNLEYVLFLDIETVPETAHFQDLDDEKQALWDHKSKYQRKDEYTHDPVSGEFVSNKL